MNVAFETLKIEDVSPHIILVEMNRPHAANALNTRMAAELIEFFEAVSMEPSKVRCIVLTGAGNAFCAGGDLKERRGMSDAAWRRQHLIFERMARALFSCPVPLIAAVNGAAVGGGCEIAAACDFIYAADTALFAFPEVSLGIIPGAGGTQSIPRAIGERRAMEMIMSAKRFSAAEACEWGLVNRVLPLQNLQDAAIEVATEISSRAPLAVRQAKQSIRRGLQMSLSDGLAFEIEAYNRLVSTKDRQEGINAANEKRRPDFRGE